MFDNEASGAHDIIGRCQASLQQLQDAAVQGRGLPLINPKKAGKSGYVSSGQCHAWPTALSRTGLCVEACMLLLLDSIHLSSSARCLSPVAGTLMVKSATVVPRPSFLDYIAGAPEALGISTCCPARPAQLSRDVLCSALTLALLV